MATCKICKEEIDWEQEDGKWKPYNYDGTRHFHPKAEAGTTSTNGRHTPRAKLTQETSNSELLQVLIRIDARLKRLVELAERQQDESFTSK